MKQSLHDIIQNENQNWVQTIMDNNDIANLKVKLKQQSSLSRKEIIKARITNLNYLVS